MPVMQEDLTILESLFNTSGDIYSHPQVEELRLYATPDKQLNSLLHYFSFIFQTSSIWSSFILVLYGMDL